MIRILHLSDVHYGEIHHAFGDSSAQSTKKRKTVADETFPKLSLVDAVAKVIASEKLRIDGIVITGDLTWQTSSQGFQSACRELNRLRQALRVRKECLMVIPGNHDVNWDSKSKKDRFATFSAVRKTLTGRDLRWDDFDYLKISKEKEGVCLIGANSATVESQEFSGIGAVGDISLESALESGRCKDANFVRVLCLHHHLLPVTYVETQYLNNKRTSITLDAKAILDICQKQGIHLVLHGHQHQPNLACYTSIDPMNVDTEKSNFPLVWIAGAGSAGVIEADLGNAKQRHFQILHFEGNGFRSKCTIQSFASGGPNPTEFHSRSKLPIHLTTQAHCTTFNPFCSLSFHLRRQSSIPDNLTGMLDNKSDKSDLNLFFLRARNCRSANEWLREHFHPVLRNTPSSHYVHVEAVYDLYGEFDLLVKVRGTDQLVKNNFEHAMKTSGFFGEPAIVGGEATAKHWGFGVNVSHEWHAMDKVPIPMKGMERSIKAFVLFKEVADAAPVIKRCEAISQKLSKYDEWKGTAVLDGLYVENEKHIVAEYFLACGAYYALNEIVQSIEELTENSGNYSIKKQTFLAQFAWEALQIRGEGRGTVKSRK